jgi:ABC-type amino acid transport system permease subunit
MSFLIRQTLIYAVPLMVVALVYLIMVVGLTTLMQRLEQRLAGTK